MTDETKHTPGPWTFDEFEDGGDEIEIIGRPVWPCRMNDRKGDWPVAKTDDLLGDHPEENLANARLIAAAPDMLAMLKKNAAFIRDQYGLSEDLVELELLIAKAEDQS